MLGVTDLQTALTEQIIPIATLTDGNKTGVLVAGGQGGGGVEAAFLVSVGAGGGSATITIEESNSLSTGYATLKNYAGTPISFAIVAGDASTTLPIKTGFRTKK